MIIHRLHDIIGPPKRIGGLIILNGPPLDSNLLDLVWPCTGNTINLYPVICADGGANRLYEHSNGKRIPTQIVGDLDSLYPTVLQHYESNGTQIIKDENQDMNDFDKSLCELHKLGLHNDYPIVIIGGFAGRLDQTLGNLNSMYIQAQQNHNIWWIHSNNVALLLSAGHHRIDIDITREGPTVGLIPIGKPVQNVTTQGLKWDLHNQPLSFGLDGLVSTSNHVLQSNIFIHTSDPLLWTAKLKSN